jgi:hypothetical protein
MAIIIEAWLTGQARKVAPARGKHRSRQACGW